MKDSGLEVQPKGNTKLGELHYSVCSVMQVTGATFSILGALRIKAQVYEIPKRSSKSRHRFFTGVSFEFAVALLVAGSCVLLSSC